MILECAIHNCTKLIRVWSNYDVVTVQETAIAIKSNKIILVFPEYLPTHHSDLNSKQDYTLFDKGHSGASVDDIAYKNHCL